MVEPDINIGLSVTVIVLYLVISVGLGLLATRWASTETLEGYALSDRAIHWFTGFFSLMASQLSALTMMGFVAFYYLEGFSGFIPIVFGAMLFAGIAFYLLGPTVWKTGRAFGYITPSDSVRDYYDSEWIGYIVALGLIISLIPYLTTQFLGLGIVIELSTGGTIEWEIAASVIAVAVLIYTWLGGMKSVVWVDTLQGIMLFGGSFVAGIVLIFTVGDGFSAAFTEIAAGRPEFYTVPIEAGAFSTWAAIISFAVIIMIGFLFHPHIWMRMHYFEDVKGAAGMPLAYGGLFWLTQIGTICAVLAGVLVIPDAPPDQFIPLMYAEFFPTLIFALIMAAILAAIMSSASSQCHAIGIVVTRDILEQLELDWPDRTYVRSARLVMAISVILALAIAIVGLPLLLESGAAAATLAFAFAGPQLWAAIRRWDFVTKEGAITASVIGGVTALAMIGNLLPTPFGIWEGSFAAVVNIVVFIVVSLITESDLPVIEEWDDVDKRPFRSLDGEMRDARESLKDSPTVDPTDD